MNILYTAIAGILLASGLQQPVFGMEAEENPYLAIVKRNAFELTDTPPSTQQKAPEPPKANDIKLTGISLLPFAIASVVTSLFLISFNFSPGLEIFFLRNLALLNSLFQFTV